MKRLFFFIATSYLLSGQVLIAQISDSAITQLYIDADMVLVCKVEKTQEIVISENNPINSAMLNSKKVKEIYKIKTESVLKSKHKAKAPKRITTPEFNHIQSIPLTLRSNASKDTLRDFVRIGIADMLNNQDLLSQHKLRISNSNRHIVMLKEEKDGFIIIYNEEYNRKHVILFGKIKL